VTGDGQCSPVPWVKSADRHFELRGLCVKIVNATARKSYVSPPEVKPEIG